MKSAALALALALAACSTPANTQILPIGSRCSSNDQCGTPPYDCAISGYPFGYCEKSCITNGDCPADSLCSPLIKECRRACMSAANCRTAEGYTCQALVGGQAVCDTTAPMDGGAP